MGRVRFLPRRIVRRASEVEQTRGHVDPTKDAAVRARAYQLWIESGYADGQQDKHWRQAEREVAARDRAAEDAPGGRDAIAPAPPHPADAPPHSDGTSRHPSVLDAGSGRSTG